MAVPALTPATFPSASTDATFGLLEVHVTSLLEAFEGATVAVSFSDFLARIVRLLLFNVTPVGLIIFGFVFTVTFTVAVRPFDVFAVTVAVPTLTPVILPPATVATLLFDDDHETICDASFGATVADTVSDVPSITVTADLLTDTLVGSV